MNLSRSSRLFAAALLATVTMAACSSDAKVATPATGAPSAAATTPGDTAAATATTAAATATTAAATATTAAAAGTTPAAADAGITIKDFTFTIPASLKAGATVTIANNDGPNHTFSDKGGAFDVKVAGGASGTLTVPAAGTYQVYCKIHQSMTGTLTVV